MQRFVTLLEHRVLLIRLLVSALPCGCLRVYLERVIRQHLGTAPSVIAGF
jgi:hypothetical protein